MRKLILLILVALPMWGAARTASVTGNWSSTTTWGGASVPGAGDTWTINGGITVTADTGTIITGTSPAAGTAIGTITTTGKLIVASGVVFQVRGDVQHFNSSQSDAIVIQPGGTFLFDGSSSGAAYQIKQANANDYSVVRADCTDATTQAAWAVGTTYRLGARVAHGGVNYVSLATGNVGNTPQPTGTADNYWQAGNCLITSVGSTASAFGYFGQGAYAVSGGGSIYGRYAAFHNLGSSSQDAVYGSPWANVFDVQHCTFDSVGRINPSAYAGVNFPLTWSYNIHSRSPGDVIMLAVANTNTAAIIVTGNVFDTAINPTASYTFKGVTLTNNIFSGTLNNNFTAYLWASFSGNFLRGTAGTYMLQGDVSDSYLWFDAATSNPHWTSSIGASYTISASIFELSHFTSGDSGEVLGVNTTGGTTIAISNSILLPDDGGLATSEWVSTTNSPASAYALGHNVYWGGYASAGFGPLQFNETQQSVTGAVSMQDSILYAQPGKTFVKSEVQNSSCSNADICSTCSYNVGYNYTIPAATITGCTNQANGYGGKWSGTPGTLDLDVSNPDDSSGPGGAGRVNPRFYDPTRQLATFGSRYLGHSATAGSWASGTTYNYGDIVTYTVSGIYWDKPVLYRCTASPTCTAGSTAEPSVGAVWRTNWELASLYYLRQGVAAQTVIADGSIGCTSCTVIQALNKWVLDGFMPTSLKLKKRAHDGTDIGPVTITRWASPGGIGGRGAAF